MMELAIFLFFSCRLLEVKFLEIQRNADVGDSALMQTERRRVIRSLRPMLDDSGTVKLRHTSLTCYKLWASRSCRILWSCREARSARDARCMQNLPHNNYRPCKPLSPAAIKKTASQANQPRIGEALSTLLSNSWEKRAQSHMWDVRHAQHVPCLRAAMWKEYLL